MALVVQISTYEELKKIIAESGKEYDREQIEAAYRLAEEKHREQKRSSGEPYIIHPLSVAAILVGLGMDSQSVMAGLLHDVVEDTDWTLEQLAAEGFPEEAMEVLALLTHPEGQPYMEYIAGLQHNPIAVKIKLADLRHNSDFTRLSAVTADQRERLERKYAPAFALLEGKDR